MDGTALAFYMTGETPSYINKTFAFSVHAAGSPPMEYPLTGASSVRPGVNAAYSHVDDSVLKTWLSDEGEVRLQFVFANTHNGGLVYGFTHPDDGRPVFGFSTPSVACGPPSTNRDCILVWANAEEMDTGTTLVKPHQLQWMQFDVDLVQSPWFSYYRLDPGEVRTGAPYLVAPPIVTYREPGSSYPFVLAYPVGGTGGTIIARKSLSETSPWQVTRVLGKAGLGSEGMLLGSANYDAELIRVFNE